MSKIINMKSSSSEKYIDMIYLIYKQKLKIIIVRSAVLLLITAYIHINQILNNRHIYSMLLAGHPNQNSCSSHALKYINKSGLSIVSARISLYNKKSCKDSNACVQSRGQNFQHNRKIDKENKNVNTRMKEYQSRKPMRSLSMERNRRKMQKIHSKTKDMPGSQTRHQMIDNINQLEVLNDQLKMKRSLMTLRESEKSVEKAKPIDYASQSQTKLLNGCNFKLTLSKCVPKSKINLTNSIKQSQAAENQSSQVPLNPIIQKCQKIIKLRKLRNQSEFPQSRMTIQKQQKGCYNLQVIPIGLNVSASNSLIFDNHISNEAAVKRNDNEQGTIRKRDLTRSATSLFRRKGISLVSCTESKRNSYLTNERKLSSSVISLEVVKQVERSIKNVKHLNLHTAPKTYNNRT